MKKLTHFSTFFSNPVKLVNYLLLSIKFCVFVFIILISVQSSAQIANVTIPTGGFNINGNVKVNTVTGDWTAGTGGGGFVLNDNGTAVNSNTSGRSTDLFNNSSDNIFTNGSKFNDYISALKWGTGTATAKDDINNGMYHVATDNSDHQWLFIASDRASITGTSYIDFELLQGTITLNSNNGTFTGSGNAGLSGRTAGDINVSMEYTNGGSKPNVVIYQWKEKTVSGKLVWLWDSAGSAALTSNNFAFAETNRNGTVDVPFGAFNSNTYQQYAFVEAGVDVTQLLGNLSTCTGIIIQTVWVKTKAAASSTAALKDFMAPIPVHFEFTPAHVTSVSALCPNAASVCLVGTPAGGTFTGTGVTADVTCASGYKFVPSVAGAGEHVITYHVTIGGSCLSEPTTTITVAARPAALVLTGSTICTSVTGTGSITSGTSVIGVSYQLYNNLNATVGSAQAGTGNGLTWSNVPAGTGYYALATGASPTNCTSVNSNTVNVAEVANPVALVLTGSSICTSAGNAGTITSGTSATAVNYQLYNSSNVAQGAAQPGTNSGLTWTGLAPGNGYYVIGTGTASPNCTSTSSPVNVTAVANPTALELTGSSICSSAPNTGTISSTTSVSGVNYQLYNSSNVTQGAAKPGTGSGLTWTTLAAGNGYYVIATGAAPTNCTSTSNTANVTSVTNPTALVLSGSSICSSAPNTGTISSTTSVSGVNYQLYNSSNVAQGAAKPGTGSGLTWTALAVGNGYYVIGTGAGATACTSTSNSVNITSVTNPTALSLTGSSICGSAPNTGTISSTTSVSGVSYQLYNSSNATVQSAKPGIGSALTWTALAAGNGYYVIGTGSGATACTSTSNTADVTSVANPSAPSVTYNAPACDATTFSVTITGVVSGATYTIKNRNGANIAGVSPGNSVVAPNTSNIVFSNIPAGSGYQVTVQVGACLSSANSCGQADQQGGARIQSTNQAEIIIEEKATVKAYPNPFSDKVKFVVTTSIGGEGNLEVYNMMGQRVKNVYTGFIAAGTQTFELSLPAQQVASLIYVLRIGDKKMTGKILQINQ